MIKFKFYNLKAIAQNESGDAKVDDCGSTSSGQSFSEECE
jgi:hypothetical protein